MSFDQSYSGVPWPVFIVEAIIAALLIYALWLQSERWRK